MTPNFPRSHMKPNVLVNTSSFAALKTSDKEGEASTYAGYPTCFEHAHPGGRAHCTRCHVPGEDAYYDNLPTKPGEGSTSSDDFRQEKHGHIGSDGGLEPCVNPRCTNDERFALDGGELVYWQ